MNSERLGRRLVGTPLVASSNDRGGRSYLKWIPLFPFGRVRFRRGFSGGCLSDRDLERIGRNKSQTELPADLCKTRAAAMVAVDRGLDFRAYVLIAIHLSDRRYAISVPMSSGENLSPKAVSSRL